MERVFADNKKALYDYFVEESYEAGMCLKGTEVKAIRQKRVHLKDSYVVIKENEPFLINCHVSPYSHGNISNHEPLRMRKLLLHTKELKKLAGKIAQKGYTLIPLRIYIKGQYIKIAIGLCKGKRQYEKREVIKEREAKREIERSMKN
ncbi:MAG: SsrA-binding protein SmpB [Candidatus Magnetobacterium sp. LHC-1]|uniref:SsrA-binding protein n=1 Tax=Candidatus Magnetobacterium casense TaxID=1455061 RepID=A0ABS6RVH1_9BACT|nr:SsrA-binding protein SmpB [Candidatus Magnetobacterium casensis]MBF0608512.1 SsrA-binding protein SmpB [Nitrospirota bacterium]MBV6340626.1 SsrA-binding protein SmpB [Candidatus Magnetobacterium casensis]